MADFTAAMTPTTRTNHTKNNVFSEAKSLGSNHNNRAENSSGG